MAKKESPKERRLREQAEKQRKYRADEMLRKEKTAAEAAPAQPVESREPENNENKKKSRAKAAGLKSVFVLSDKELLMTSFGNGNRAIREKHIVERTVDSLQSPAAFTAEPEERRYAVMGRGITAYAADPLWERESARTDIIGCKAELEKRYFGKTFEDNIHIQLIYNLLDLEKHLAVQVNNMVYSLNNVLLPGEAEGEADYDLIGYLGLQNTFGEFCNPEKYRTIPDEVRTSIQEKKKAFDSLIQSRRIGYFGSAFCKAEQKKDGGAQKLVLRDEEDIYYTLCLLGALRQTLAHDKLKLSAENPYLLGSAYDSLFRDRNQLEIRKKARALLEKTYAEQVHRLNAGFLNNAKADLAILFHALDASDEAERQQIAQDYYRFIVRKDQKNMGFSLRELRETILKGPAVELTGQNYDALRSRLYRTFDFMAFRWFKADEKKRADPVVDGLRAAQDELAKSQVYERTAKELWKAIGGNFMEKVAPRLKGSGDIIKKLKAETVVQREWLDEVLVPEKVSAFSELIYLLTLFQDGKEINILLTGLINKLENVQSFLAVMQESDIEAKFKKEYELFAHSGDLAQELRIVLSFARMEKPAPGAKRPLFVDAARILGDESSEEELTAYWDKYLEASTREVKVDHTLRNFIASNVIESDRFKYLVRYLNPEKARKLAKCRPAVAFALKDIPKAQIVRYVNACEGLHLTEADFTEKMRSQLADMITGMTFAQFETVNNQNVSDKQQKAALISLYLTILYLIAKNLIYVNTRYFIAFHAYERDLNLMKEKPGFETVKNKMKENAKYQPYLEFAGCWLETHKTQRNQRSLSYLKQNLENANGMTTREFRNQVEHLTPIRNADKYIGDIASIRSWFSLYHYLMQRTIMDAPSCAAESGSKTAEYYRKIQAHHSYGMDFLKALCIPFCYNLARYKNLSIEPLFDRNIPMKKGEKAPKEGPTGE